MLHVEHETVNGPSYSYYNSSRTVPLLCAVVFLSHLRRPRLYNLGRLAEALVDERRAQPHLGRRAGGDQLHAQRRQTLAYGLTCSHKGSSSSRTMRHVKTTDIGTAAVSASLQVYHYYERM